MGGVVTALDVTASGRERLTIDVTCAASDTAHAEQITAALAAIDGVTIGKVSDRTFLMHLGGKIEIQPKVPIRNRDDLSMIYTPGVARICLAIAENPSDARRLTIKRNTVAVVTDGSAVLGLGNLGAMAALPVMEGKAALFKRFAGIDAFPICLDTQDVDEIVRTVELIAPVFAGINLEDISAPRCFEIERRLREKLDIPVFHDDQHGTAIVVLAALINALKVVGKRLEDVRIVMSGAGAAGMAILTVLLAAGARHVVVSDKDGVVHPARPGLGPELEWIATNTNEAGLTGTLREALRDSEVFIGVSAPNLLTGDDIATMAPGQHRLRPGQPGARGRPAGGLGARGGGRERSQRLPQPDQQRAGVPRGVPWPHRRPQPHGDRRHPDRGCPRPRRRCRRRRAQCELHRAQRVQPRRDRRRLRRSECGGARDRAGRWVRPAGRAAWWLFAVAVVANLVLLYWPRAPGTGGIPHLDKAAHLVSFALVTWTGCSRRARDPRPGRGADRARDRQ